MSDERLFAFDRNAELTITPSMTEAPVTVIASVQLDVERECLVVLIEHQDETEHELVLKPGPALFALLSAHVITGAPAAA